MKVQKTNSILITTDIEGVRYAKGIEFKNMPTVLIEQAIRIAGKQASRLIKHHRKECEICETK